MDEHHEPARHDVDDTLDEVGVLRRRAIEARILAPVLTTVCARELRTVDPR